MKTSEIRLGRYDDTARQCQPEYTADLLKSHVAVFGEFGKGKATMLWQIILQIHLHQLQLPQKEEIHILSFGNRLAEAAALPLVASYMDGGDAENVRRIFRLMVRKLEANKKQLAGRRFAESGDAAIPHVTFVIEGAEKLYAADDARQESYREALLRMAREGLASGVSLVCSADAPVGGVARLLEHNFRRVVAFTLTSAEHYSNIFPRRVREGLPLPGRGLALLEREAMEFQAYLPWPSVQQREAFLRRFAAAMEKRVRFPAEKLKILSGELTAESWKNFCAEPFARPGFFTAGLDYENVRPVCIDLKTAGSILITGKKGGGKTNLLRGIVAGALGIPDCRFVLYETGRTGLAEIKAQLTQAGAGYVSVRDPGALLAHIAPGGAELPPVRRVPLPAAAPLAAVSVPRFDFSGLLTGEVPPDAAPGGTPLPPQMPVPTAAAPEPPVQEASFAIPAAPEPPVQEAPPAAFTVVIVQSDRMTADLMESLLPHVLKAQEKDMLFVFADARAHSPAAAQLLGGSIPYVFVLDDIIRFAQNGRGCFADMDMNWLKEQFGAAGTFYPGEGFFCDIDGDEIVRFKALLQPETTPDPT